MHLEGAFEVIEAALACALLLGHTRVQRLVLRRHAAQPLLLLHPAHQPGRTC